MARKKALKMGETVTQKVVDRDGNVKTVTSRVIGFPGRPKKLSEVTGPKTSPAGKKKPAANSDPAPAPAE